MNSKRGFTLIELLVVIAIIGILAGIVLTSLGTARNKGRMASAQASMSSMRAEAELSVNTNGQYPATLCSLDTNGALGAPLTALATAVTTNGGTAPICSRNGATITAWAASADIDPSGTVTNFCIDSSGWAGTGRTAGTGGVCV